MGKPRGFFVVDGRVVWATGWQYTATGSNPWRTSTERLSGGELYHDWSADGALTRPASVEEAREFVAAIEKSYSDKAARLRAEAEKRILGFGQIVSEHRQHLEAMGSTLAKGSD